ncbi:hypothetical protein JKP88DRAFT_237524 [Tribonema minus]|uniref:Secreted protein n=1 Tax=Tribonema minus TaxID=303371 RepID=A0A835Z952_9STRA|nr:hypothetical protein JKP88DRAFT_237524 [Tribonema minus]
MRCIIMQLGLPFLAGASCAAPCPFPHHVLCTPLSDERVMDIACCSITCYLAKVLHQLQSLLRWQRLDVRNQILGESPYLGMCYVNAQLLRLIRLHCIPVITCCSHHIRCGSCELPCCKRHSFC